MPGPPGRGATIGSVDPTQPKARRRARDPAPYRALVHPPGARYIEAIDQRALPHAVVTARIADADTAALAIRKMWVRGAPLIGAVGAYGLALALERDATRRRARQGARRARRDAADGGQPALGARPRARSRDRRFPSASARRRRVARGRRDLPRGRGDQSRDRHARARAAARHRRDARAARCNVMTHCNAGALATCGWGTATAPLFLAHADGPRAARVGERDAAAAAGREPHGLGDGPARRSAHAVRRRGRARC